MSRILKPTLPQPPSGFEDRVISTKPRPAADNGSAYEARIYQANAKYDGQISVTLKDRNLYSRVSDVRDVSATPSYITFVYTDEGEVSSSIVTYRDSAYDITSGAGAPASHMYAWVSVESSSVSTVYTTTLAIKEGASGTPVYEYNSQEEIPWTLAEGYILEYWEHDINKYPGESAYFIKECLTSEGGYLTLTLANNTSLKAVANEAGAYNYSLEYCNDGASWKTLLLGVDIPADSSHKIYLRGRIAKLGGLCPKLSGNANSITKVEGDLTALMSYRTLGVPPTLSHQFRGMFEGCTSLTDASGLTFPTANFVHSYVFKNMFKGCTALTSAPDLSPYKLHTGIYEGMFYNCSALTTAPALPNAEILPYRAYYEMFRGCSLLASITAYIGKEIEGDAIRDWMVGAGTGVDGTRTFNHAEDTFRWRYPSTSGIPNTYTDVPTLTTKCYIDSVTGGSISVTANGAAITSGESVARGATLVATATHISGYTFDHWACTGITGTSVGNVFTCSSYPYGRFEDGDDKITISAVFHKIDKNLYVRYPLSGTTSNLAFVRFYDGDLINSPSAPATHMYCWRCVDTVLIYRIYTIKEWDLASTDKIYTHQVIWEESTATIASDVWTKQFSVVVLNNNASIGQSQISVVSAGGTYHNDYTSFCTCLADAGSTVTVTVPNNVNLIWNDGTSTNPKVITPVVADRGVLLIAEANIPYVKFEGTAGTFTSLSLTSGQTLQVSNDGTTFTDHNFASAATVTNGAIYVRGVNQTTAIYGFSGSFTTVSGNVHSLVNYTDVANGTVPQTQPVAFSGGTNPVKGLFYNVTTLTGAANIIVPYTELKSHGCTAMFRSCTSLVTAPNYLFAGILGNSCYASMFYGCTSLTTVPSILHGTVLYDDCCNSMFQGCTALTKAPLIIATSLDGDFACARMFKGCTSLSEISVNATSIGYAATWDWVDGCTHSGMFFAADDTQSMWESQEAGSGIPTNFVAYYG